MANILFSRVTGKATGLNRPPLPFETEIQVADDFSCRKTDSPNRWQRKKTAQGNFLYWDEGKEVTYSRKPIKFTEETRTHQSVSESGEVLEVVETYKVPTFYKDLDPVLIEAPSKPLHFSDNYMSFTYEEILACKKDCIERQTGKTLAYFNETMTMEDFSTDLSSFSADSVLGKAVLHPHGQIRTAKLSIPSTKKVWIYAEMQDGIQIEVGNLAHDLTIVSEGVWESETPVKELYVKFKNQTAQRLEIASFGLLI